MFIGIEFILEKYHAFAGKFERNEDTKYKC